MKRNIFRLFLSAVLMMCCTVMANAINSKATKIDDIYYILDDATHQFRNLGNQGIKTLSIYG